MKLRIIGFSSVYTIILIYACFLGNEKVKIVFVALTILILISVLYTVIGYLSIRTKIRYLNQDVQKYQHNNIVITVINPTPLFFFFIESKLLSSVDLNMSSDRKIFYLKPFSSRDIEYGTVFNYRGVYSLGPEIFTVNSLIGILKLRKHIPLNKPVRVYPRELEVKDFNVMISLNEDGDGPIKTETTNTEPYQFKEYQETDDIRHVHWKLSSRSENLIVKEYSVRYSINLMLYLTPFSKDSGINRIQKEDMLIESFISVCKFLLDSGIEYEVVYAEGENVVKKAILNSRDYMEFYNITPSLVFNETFAQEMQNKYNQCIDACNKDIYFFTSDLDDDTLYYINSVKLLENEIICFHCNQNGINIEAYDKFKCADIPYTMIKYENDSLICISDLSYLQQSYGG